MNPRWLTAPELRVSGLSAGYEAAAFAERRGGTLAMFRRERRHIDVLASLSFAVRFEDRVATVVGPNGCGKSTLLRTIAGSHPARGTIAWRGGRLDGLAAAERRRAGVILCPHDRAVFPRLTVADHVRLLACLWKQHASELVDRAFAVTPPSGRDTIAFLRTHTRVGDLSGGQRKLLGLLRLLAPTGVTLALVDEPYAGLSPAGADVYDAWIRAVDGRWVLEGDQVRRPGRNQFVDLAAARDAEA